MKIAIIPCRSGSKRIKNKNIINFAGKPMIYWTIMAAKKSKLFDKIVVSYDYDKLPDEITSIPGVVFLKRLEGYSDDQTTVQEACIKTLEQLNVKDGIVIQLLATCPNRTAKNIKDAYNYFNANNDIDFLISSSEYLQQPAWAIDSILHRPLYPEAIKDRSQDLIPVVCPNGAIWIGKIDRLFLKGTFYGNWTKFFKIPFSEGIDIDTYEDLHMAKLLRKKDKTKTNDIKKVLWNYRNIKEKIKIEENDILLLKKEKFKNTVHKKNNESWINCTDDEIRINQKINKYKRSVQRNKKMMNKLDNILAKIKNTTSYHMVILEYYVNHGDINEIIGRYGISKSKFYMAQKDILKEIMFFLEG